MKRELTPKQERFCQEYIKDLNATQAAIRAGFSERTAMEQGYQLLRKTSVKKRVSQLKEKQAKRLEISADTILRELLALATVDVTQAFDDFGGLKPFKEMPEAVRKALAGLEVTELFDGKGDQKHAIGLLRKVRFWDKPKALELLGKHLKLFTEKHEHTGKDGGPIEHKNLSEIPDAELRSRIDELLANRTPPSKEEG